MFRKSSGQQALFEEILSIDCLERLIDRCKRPVSIFRIEIPLALRDDIFAELPDEAISSVELDGGAAYRSDAHNGMVERGAIAHQE